MGQDQAAVEFFQEQDSAIIARIPEAEPIIGRWRDEYDPSARFGVPAHVTILFPWIPSEQIDTAAIARIHEIAAGFEPFGAVFGRVELVPGVVWLRPEPEEPFRALTAAMWEAFPDHPPYEGKHEEVIPHMTIADSGTEPPFADIRAAVTPESPIVSEVTEIEVIAFTGARWQTVSTAGLGPATGALRP